MRRGERSGGDRKERKGGEWKGRGGGGMREKGEEERRDLSPSVSTGFSVALCRVTL